MINKLGRAFAILLGTVGIVMHLFRPEHSDYFIDLMVIVIWLYIINMPVED